MPSDFFVLFLFLLGQLQIAESEESDQGKYECVAKNEVGSQYSYSAQLYVRGKYLSKKRKRNINRLGFNPKRCGGEVKMTHWSGDRLPFLTGPCYGHKNS